MKMNFKTATDYLLFSDEDYYKIKLGIDYMLEKYADATQIEAGDLTNEQLIETENGHIVTPVHAAHCLKDIMRTTQFLRGIYKAIKDRIEFTEEPVEILYAGCGPYATLLTPLTTQFNPNQVQFTMLEYNPISMTAMQKLYEQWGIQDYIKSCVRDDATSPDIPLKGKYDIIISETMQAVLRTECQVPLTRNLVRFLKPEGTFIPQNVFVDAHLVGHQKVDIEHPESLLLENIYNLDYNNVPPKNHSKTIAIPKHKFEYLYFFTRIKVYEEEQIAPYASGLTFPLICDRFVEKPKSISFTYIENGKPDFEKAYHFD